MFISFFFLESLQHAQEGATTGEAFGHKKLSEEFHVEVAFADSFIQSLPWRARTRVLCKQVLWVAVRNGECLVRKHPAFFV